MALRLGARLATWGLRTRSRLVRALLGVFERLLPSFSLSGVQALAATVGTLVWLLDARGREVGRQNLEAVFGETKSRAERARILRASYRNALFSELILLHLQPVTPARYQRLVRMDPDDEARYRRYASERTPVVLVSGHLGSWELLVLGRAAYAYAPPFAYLVESTGHPDIDQVLERLRNAGGRGSAQRKRGALALKQALAQGRSVSLMMDRNLWGQQGGVYVPFLGLSARTTPLGAVLARAFDVPLAVTLLLPEGPLRWRLWISEDMRPPASADAEADVAQALRRSNEVLSQAILRHPEAYLWNLKRFKSRPTAEQGRYPAYSHHDPAP
jgi:lauroyl/myristoyl acyltransferase